MKVLLALCGMGKVAVGKAQWHGLVTRRTGDAESAYESEATTT